MAGDGVPPPDLRKRARGIEESDGDSLAVGVGQIDWQVQTLNVSFASRDGGLW